jgi:CRISPR/Cas system-associated endonuclease Cas1
LGARDGRGGRFFGRYGDAERLLELYFDLAEFWKDLSVLRLPLSIFEKYLAQSARITAERKRG